MVDWAAKLIQSHPCQVIKKNWIIWLDKFGCDNVDTSILWKIGKFNPEQWILVTQLSLLYFYNFLALNNFFNAVSLLYEVWQVVP